MPTVIKKNPILCVDNVTIGYDKVPVLKNVNLVEYDIEIDGVDITGQTITFVSRSGRGKSTFLNALCGLISPMSGNIYINKEHSNNENDNAIVKEGDVAFVDQKYTLFRHMTIEKILMFSMRNLKLTNQEKEAKITELLSKWDLVKQRKQYPSELSGGQRQRVAILSKEITGRKFLVMDEPISGLDPIAIENVKEMMDDFKSQNTLNTIILTTHDLYFATLVSDVIYILGHENQADTTSTIVGVVDLRERGLIRSQTLTMEHIQITEEIKDILRKS